MGLVLVFFWRSVTAWIYSRLGAFNSRLGVQKFPFKALRDFACNYLIRLAVFGAKTALPRQNRKNSRFHGKNREFGATAGRASTGRLQPADIEPKDHREERRDPAVVARSRLRDRPHPAGGVKGYALDAAGNGVAPPDAAARDVKFLDGAPPDLAARHPQSSRRCDRGALRVGRDRQRRRGHSLAQHRAIGQPIENRAIEFEYSARPVFLIGADPDRVAPRGGERPFEARPERKAAEGWNRVGKSARQIDLEQRVRVGDVELPRTGIGEASRMPARWRNIEMTGGAAARRIETKHAAGTAVHTKAFAAVGRYQQAALGVRQPLRVPTLIEPRHP